MVLLSVGQVTHDSTLTAGSTPSPSPYVGGFETMTETYEADVTSVVFLTDVITDSGNDGFDNLSTDTNLRTNGKLISTSAPFSSTSLQNVSGTGTDGFNLTGTVITETLQTTENIDTVTAEIVSRVATACLMSLFLFVTIVGNILVLLVLKHRYRKFSPRIGFMYNFIAIMLCDGFCNMSIAWGAVLAGKWPYGMFICQFSSFLLNTFNTLTLFALLHLTTDRFLAIKKPDWHQRNVGIVVSLTIIVCTWFYTVAFNVAIFAGAVPSNYYINRFICGVSSGADLIFIIFCLVLNLLLPLSAVSIFFIIIAKMATVARNGEETLPEDEVFLRKPKLISVVENTKLIAILIIFWCILEGPYQVIHTVYLFSKGETDVLISFSIETIATWMKFLYPALVPIFILISFVDNQKVQKLGPEHLDMVPSDEIITRAPRNEAGIRTSWASEASENTPKSTLNRSFNIPVLFPTSEGVCMRVGEESFNGVSRQGGTAMVNTIDKYVREKVRKEDRVFPRPSALRNPKRRSSLPDLNTLSENDTNVVGREGNYAVDGSNGDVRQTFSPRGRSKWDRWEPEESGNGQSVFQLSLSKNTDTFAQTDFHLPATPVS